MSGLSLMQTRSFIDRLGDLDEEITKVCRAADVMAKGCGKEHADGVARLKEACAALEEKQKFVREAKDHLLGLDGFMHALSGEMRQLMEHPKMGSAVSRIAERMSAPMQSHVSTIVEETVDGLRRVAADVKSLREAKEDAKRAGSIKDSAKALSKVCDAAENALRKAMKHASEPEDAPESEEMAESEKVVVEKAAGEVGFHGYNLTAKELPPEFLENIKKKKEEAEDKKDDDKDDEKKSSKKADSRVPGNKSKGPKDEGEEDEGWVPGHRTGDKDEDEKESGKKANSDHGYVLTAKELPPEFLENAKKKKEEAEAKKDDDKKSDKKAKDKKVPELGGDSETEGPEQGAPEPEDDPRHEKHGYDLYEPVDHGYELFA